jgi:hypothetical protein
MDDWFVQPERVRLDLSGGQWIVVKRRLNYGELRHKVERMTRRGPDGQPEFDAIKAGVAIVTAYLLEWSLSAPFRSAGDLEPLLDSLDPERFREIRTAIETHELAQAEAREQEKKRLAGANGAGATSASPFAAAGASSGSARSIATTTAS